MLTEYSLPRAIIFMEADNPDIGLMCFVGIGMDEVSTCEITAKEGKRFCNYSSLAANLAARHARQEGRVHRHVPLW